MGLSIISCLSEFNTHRMVRDYTEKMYIPVAKRYFIPRKQEVYQKIITIGKMVSGLNLSWV